MPSNAFVGSDGSLAPSGNPWTPPEENGTGGQEAYPFRNFWSVEGGLDEVLFAIPSREQADILVTAFFKYVDPLYPIIPENLFRSRFEEFWALPPIDRYATPELVHAKGFVRKCSHDGIEANSTQHGSLYSSLCSLRATYMCKTQQQLTSRPFRRRTYHAATGLCASSRS